MLRRASLTLAASLAVWSAEARAEAPLPCMLIPGPGCTWMPHLELALSGGIESDGLTRDKLFHGGAEIGVLMASAANPALHWGPVFDVAADVASGWRGWSGGPRIKVRYWPIEWIDLDAAAGLTFERYFTVDTTAPALSGARAGPIVDVGMGVHGVAGPFAEVALLEPMEPLGRASEVRVIAGVRGTLTFWAALACGLARCR